MADELRAAIGRPQPAEPTADRLGKAVRRVADELAGLAADLADAAGAAERADLAAARRLEGVTRTVRPGPR